MTISVPDPTLSTPTAIGYSPTIGANYLYAGAGVTGANYASSNNMAIAGTSLRSIYKSAVAVSKSDADTTETTLASVSIPAGAMSETGVIRIATLWSVPSSAATKRLRARFGGSVLFNIDLTTSLSFTYEFILRGRGSISSQVSQPSNAASWSTFGSSGVATTSIDFSTTQILTITGQWPVAAAGANNITLEGYEVVVER